MTVRSRRPPRTRAGPRTCSRSCAGTAMPCGSRSQSTPTTARSSPGPPARAASAGSPYATSCCLRSSAASAPWDPLPGGVAGRQRQLLHGPRDGRLRSRHRPRAVLHARAQPAVQRHRRGVRENLQARLHSAQRRPDATALLAELDRWFEDYNEMHPHRALGMRSPRDFIRAHQLATCPV